MNGRPDFSIDPLEPRRLFAGVTMLIHGNDGNITGWVKSAASAIAKRTGNASQVSQYVMKVGDDSTGRLVVQSFKLASGPDFNKSTLAEAVVKLDWTAVDSGSVSTGDVGKVVANYMLAKHGKLPPLAELPIHLIGHSRGASLAVAISGNLALRGVWVDQETFLDPHPIDGHNDFLFADFGDTPMRVYDNVIFADDYWRQSGTNPIINALDPDGEAVTGAHNFNLDNTVGKQFIVSAHMAVTAYYHGTIDFNALTNGDNAIFPSWYGNTPDKPAKNQTGFLFSRIGGGVRPLDGVGTNFGGKATRHAVKPQDTQWANITGLTTNAARFHHGAPITVNFRQQDRDSGSSVTLFLDRDTNPYNGTAQNLRTVAMAKTGSPTSTKVSLSNASVPSGTYYVEARITDPQGHSRFAYSKPITIG